MAKKAPAEPREIFLGEWLNLFEIGPTKAAEIAGCTQSYISNISAGRRANINALFLLKLSEEMGVTVNDLFKKPPPKAQINQLNEYSPSTRAALLDLKRKQA